MKDKKTRKLRRKIKRLKLDNEFLHFRYQVLMRSYLRMTTELEELKNNNISKGDLDNG